MNLGALQHLGIECLQPGLQIIAGSFRPNGTGVVDNTLNVGKGFTVLRTPDVASHEHVVFSANPTTADGVKLTCGNASIQSDASPGAGEFTLGATLPLTLAALVTAYNLQAGRNVVASHDGVDTLTFTAVTAGTEGDALTLVEDTDTDGVMTLGHDHLRTGSDGDGLFTITLSRAFKEICGLLAAPEKASAADLSCQGGAISASAGTVAIRVQAGATPTDMASDADSWVHFAIFARDSAEAA